MFFNPVHANNQLHHFHHSNDGGYFGGGSPAPGTGASRIRRDNDGKIRRKGDAKKIAESMKEDPTFAMALRSLRFMYFFCKQLLSSFVLWLLWRKIGMGVNNGLNN